MLKNMLNFSSMKYKWIITCSILTLAIGLTMEYTGLLNLQNETIIYSIPILLGVIWCILNFIMNYREDYLLKLHDSNIDTYLKKLDLSSEEQKELKDYISDYLLDLEGSGVNKKEAMKKAISEFNLHDSNTNYSSSLYLVTLAIICIFITAISNFIANSVSLTSIWLNVLQNTAFTYSLAFVATFIIYQILFYVLRTNKN